MPQLPPPPTWCRSLKWVAQFEHAHVVSNSQFMKPVPSIGNGLTMDEHEPFHLALLKRSNVGWDTDRFWYLGMLPDIPTLSNDPLFHPFGIDFNRLPIVQVPGGFQLEEGLRTVWADLEHLLDFTCRILSHKFLNIIPYATCLPPNPSSANYLAVFETADGARRSAHRARRLVLAWLCYAACCIASSLQSPNTHPPYWFQILENSEPPFPPFWLDTIGRSPILADFTGDLPRRGLYLNVIPNWQVMPLLHIFVNAGVVVSLCYPKGFSSKSLYQKYFAPPIKALQQLLELNTCVPERSTSSSKELPPADSLAWGFDMRGPDFSTLR